MTWYALACVTVTLVAGVISTPDATLATARRTAVSLGIRVRSGRMVVLLPRSTALPAKASKTFSNGGQVEILAGEHSLAKDNYKLGNLQISPAIPERARIRLAFEMDLSGLLTATVEEELSGRTATYLFENFRDIQNVLSVMESQGSWRMLTSFTEKIHTRGMAASTVTGPSRPLQSDVTPAESWDVQATAGSPSDGVVQPIVTSPDLIGACAVASAALVAVVLAFARFCGFDIAVSKTYGETELHVEKSKVARLSKRLQAAEASLAQLNGMEGSAGKISSKASERQSRIKQHGVDDLSFVVYNKRREHWQERIVKIQCPGVTHQDIEIEIVVNGAIVKITREASQGVSRLDWKKKFQFPMEEGLFEFKEEEVTLELGILYIVFKLLTPKTRVFRLPQQFERPASLASSWACPVHDIMQFSEVYASSSELTASPAHALQGDEPTSDSACQPTLVSLPFQVETFPLSSLPTESSRQCSSSAAAASSDSSSN